MLVISELRKAKLAARLLPAPGPAVLFVCPVSITHAMLQAIGSHYINVRKYLMVDGAADAELSLSREDKQLIHQGKVPSVFRSNASGADLNGAAYRLIGKLVYERMDRLGYFEEVRQELGLEKSTQELLKEDPDYFTKLINAN